MENSIDFSILSIKESLYSFDCNYNYELFSEEFLGFQLKKNFAPKFEDNTLAIDIGIRYIDVRNDTILAENMIRVNFSIVPLESVVNSFNEGKLVTNNSAIIDTALNIAIGVMRGVLYKNLKGTPLEKYILPPISLESLKENTHANSK